jgi:membrane protein
MATAARRSAKVRPGRKHGVVAPVADAFAQHNLLTYAGAISFQGLVALLPLSLLGLGLLGTTGNQDIWNQHIAPAIERRVTPAMFGAIADTAKTALGHASGGLILFAGLLSLWYLTMAMRAVIEALNRIHDVKDERPFWLRALIAVGLGFAAGVCLFGSVLLVTAARGNPLLGVGRWLLAIALLGLLVGLVVRFAPAERPHARWASVGAVLVVGFWIVASLLFRVWVTYVANFKTPVGNLTALLVLTSYLFISALVFLVGIQLDELARKSTGGRARNILELFRS